MKESLNTQFYGSGQPDVLNGVRSKTTRIQGPREVVQGDR